MVLLLRSISVQPTFGTGRGFDSGVKVLYGQMHLEFLARLRGEKHS